MTIRNKLYLAFASLLVLVVFINALSSWNQALTRESMGRAIQSSKNIERLRFQMMQNRLDFDNYLFTGSPRDLETFENGRKLFDTLTQQVSGDSSATDRQRNALQNVADAEKEWYANFAQPVIAKRKNATRRIDDFNAFYISEDPTSWLKKISTHLNEAEVDNQQELDAQNDFTTRKNTLIAVAGTLLICVLGTIIASFTAKTITHPLAQLMTVTREITESGDLEQSFIVDRQDEIGQLAATFKSMIISLKDMASISEAVAGGDLSVAIKPRSKNDTLMLAFARMTDSLRSMVRTVRDSATQVAGGSNQVADASDNAAKVSVQASSAIDEVTSTMHEMSVNVQNMVKNTQTQAISVSETSASIDEMVASIQRVADTSKVLLDISQRSREEVHQGITTMDKTTDGLSRINGAIQAAGQIIDALGKRADSIGNIVEVIDDLAEQTNLLALNAAIEAARAGEHGSGFAVVADEVRKLAEKSAASAKEISDLIASIQNESRQAVDKMEKSTNIVNEGLALGNDLQAALRKISNVVTEVYKFAQEIGAATSEQSHGSTQIAKATTRLNEITHEINSSVEEQATGAQAVVRAMEKMRELIAQTTSGSTELAASAEQMSKMSRNLLETMDRFVLESLGNGNGATGSHNRADAEEARYSAALRS
ncbi:MAG TPA: methyl-accepting chemotaxis protein [Terriglobales bacterium]|jgi:methyl-accepting chemotaxis protein|nr:methyl-accepting chemotaxis protein [Terriglobales bacterium]